MFPKPIPVSGRVGAPDFVYTATHSQFIHFVEDAGPQLPAPASLIVFSMHRAWRFWDPALNAGGKWGWGGAGQHAKCKAIVSQAASTPMDSPKGVSLLGIQCAHIASSAFGEFSQSALIMNWRCTVERCLHSVLIRLRSHDKGSLV